jgi:hypothetical protein
MSFSVEIVNERLTKRGWRSVYSRDAVDVLVALHDAVEAGQELYKLKPYLDNLAHTTRGSWKLSKDLATPVLIDFCQAAQHGIEVDVNAYLDRLAWCAGEIRVPMVLPMDIYTTLEPNMVNRLLRFFPIRVVA